VWIWVNSRIFWTRFRDSQTNISAGATPLLNLHQAVCTLCATDGEESGYWRGQIPHHFNDRFGRLLPYLPRESHPHVSAGGSILLFWAMEADSLCWQRRTIVTLHQRGWWSLASFCRVHRVPRTAAVANLCYFHVLQFAVYVLCSRSLARPELLFRLSVAIMRHALPLLLYCMHSWKKFTTHLLLVLSLLLLLSLVDVFLGCLKTKILHNRVQIISRAVSGWQGVMYQDSVVSLHQHRNSLQNRKAPSLSSPDVEIFLLRLAKSWHADVFRGPMVLTAIGTFIIIIKVFFLPFVLWVVKSRHCRVNKIGIEIKLWLLMWILEYWVFRRSLSTVFVDVFGEWVPDGRSFRQPDNAFSLNVVLSTE